MKYNGSRVKHGRHMALVHSVETLPSSLVCSELNLIFSEVFCFTQMFRNA